MICSLNNIVKEIIDNRGKNPPEYTQSGIPVIDNYLISDNYYPDLSKVKRYISLDIYNSFIRKKTIKDDVLITLVGNGYGNVALAPELTIIIQNTIGLRTDSKTCLQKYLYYLLMTRKEAIKGLNRGCAQPSIKVSDLLSLKFELPAIQDQQHIVDIISFVLKCRLLLILILCFLRIVLIILLMSF